jgi:hypothetical protein
MTNMNRRSWFPEDDEKLRNLAAGGASLTEIATQMDRGVSSVRTRSLKLGVAIARDRNPMKGSPRNPPTGRARAEHEELIKGVREHLGQTPKR